VTLAMQPTGPADMRDAEWLAEQVADLGRGIEAARLIWSNWFDGRQVGRLHPGHTPGDYIASLGMRLTLPEALAAMPDASTRQVAAVAGVDNATVHRARVADATPDPAPIRGADGKSYPRTVVREVTAQIIDPAPDHRWNPGVGLMSSDTPEWYTPRRVLAAVVDAIGPIDLDPCAEPAKSVPAALHFTEADDGLSREWIGSVYMNPPYGRPIVAWISKLVAEYRAGRTTEAIALVPARVETDWYLALDHEWECQIHGRLAFSDHDTAAPFPSMAVYLGPDGDRFESVFVALGDVKHRRPSGRYGR